MKLYISFGIFIAILLAVAAFILATTGSMPGSIASHFNGAGEPNDFMSKQGYRNFMLIFSVGLPILVVCGIALMLRFAKGLINIPNPQYWLSPENKDNTVRILLSHCTWLGSLMSVFIAFVHWLLIKANQVTPPQLDNVQLFIGAGLFFIGIIVWGMLISIKFRRTDNQVKL